MATCTGGLVPSITHILNAQIATCTVTVVRGGGSGVMEEVPWDGSMWWLYIIIIIIFGHVTLWVYDDVGCTCICMWQSVLAVVHLHASLPLAGLCTNTPSPFVSP